MATTKPTRSPRRAQLPAPPVSPLNRPRQRSTPSGRGLPLKPYAEKLVVYEALHALNRDFEQVLADLAKLQELGVFQHDRFTIFRIMVQETRAWANMVVAELLQMREEDDLGWFGRLHRRWEKKREDPNDALRDAKALIEKRRKAAARKKSAGSKG